MYEYLMQLANAEAAKSAHYATFDSASGLDREILPAKVQYHNGRASGLREAAISLAANGVGA